MNDDFITPERPKTRPHEFNQTIEPAKQSYETETPTTWNRSQTTALAAVFAVILIATALVFFSTTTGRLAGDVPAPVTPATNNAAPNQATGNVGNAGTSTSTTTGTTAGQTALPAR